MRPSYPLAVLLTTAFCAPAAALELPDCPLRQGSMDSCSPIVACMPGDGVYLVGRAIGWDRGTLSGETSTGDWSYDGPFGTAHASFACDDGLSGRVIFHAEDSLTGTGRAIGMTNGGARIDAWAGRAILPYLDRTGRRVDGTLMCGDVPMMLSLGPVEVRQAAVSSR